MKTVLNLIDVNKSSIDWKIDYFPDGQINFRFINFSFKHNVDNMILRIKSSNDLFMLMQIKDIIDRAEIKIENITILYLLGARQDRVMDLSQPYTLKLVAEIINAFGANVRILEPHSDRALELINHSEAIFLSPKNILGDEPMQQCFPDEGAGLKYIKRPPLMYATYSPTDGVTSNVACRHSHNIYCSKVREADNSLHSFKILNPEKYIEPNSIILIDDLCDGGGTFCGLVKELRKLNPPAIYLFVTHAIQLDGIKKVASVYDKVFITNSYADWDLCEDLPRNVHVIDIIKDYV